MKKNEIIALGCSWTDKYDLDVDPWPKIIEKTTNYNVVNYGKTGSGNKYAFDNFLVHIKYFGAPNKVYWLLSEFDRIDVINLKNPNGSNSYRPNSFAKRLYNNGFDHFDKNRHIEYEKALITWLKRNPDADEEAVDLFEKSINADWSLLKILVNTFDLELVIDYNLDLIYKVQSICEYYNIELKIMAALPPFNPYGSLENSKIASKILKSRFSKKINLKNISGWPFMPISGGMCMHDIKDWGSTYSIGKYDSHPNQLGSNLIADFFLGKKNIFEYK